MAKAAQAGFLRRGFPLGAAACGVHQAMYRPVSRSEQLPSHTRAVGVHGVQGGGHRSERLLLHLRTLQVITASHAGQHPVQHRHGHAEDHRVPRRTEVPGAADHFTPGPLPQHTLIEHRLEAAGVPLLASDEPINFTGSRTKKATQVLTRRVKQGVAE